MGSFFMGSSRQVLSNFRGRVKALGNDSTKIIQERFVIQMCKLPKYKVPCLTSTFSLLVGEVCFFLIIPAIAVFSAHLSRV